MRRVEQILSGMAGEWGGGLLCPGEGSLKRNGGKKEKEMGLNGVALPGLGLRGKEGQEGRGIYLEILSRQQVVSILLFWPVALVLFRIINVFMWLFDPKASRALKRQLLRV